MLSGVLRERPHHTTPVAAPLHAHTARILIHTHTRAHTGSISKRVFTGCVCVYARAAHNPRARRRLECRAHQRRSAICVYVYGYCRCIRTDQLCASQMHTHTQSTKHGESTSFQIRFIKNHLLVRCAAFFMYQIFAQLPQILVVVK